MVSVSPRAAATRSRASPVCPVRAPGGVDRAVSAARTRTWLVVYPSIANWAVWTKTTRTNSSKWAAMAPRRSARVAGDDQLLDEGGALGVLEGGAAGELVGEAEGVQRDPLAGRVDGVFLGEPPGGVAVREHLLEEGAARGGIGVHHVEVVAAARVAELASEASAQERGGREGAALGAQVADAREGAADHVAADAGREPATGPAGAALGREREGVVGGAGGGPGIGGQGQRPVAVEAQGLLEVAGVPAAGEVLEGVGVEHTHVAQHGDLAGVRGLVAPGGVEGEQVDHVDAGALAGLGRIAGAVFAGLEADHLQRRRRGGRAVLRHRGQQPHQPGEEGHQRSLRWRRRSRASRSSPTRRRSSAPSPRWATMSWRSTASSWAGRSDRPLASAAGAEPVGLGEGAGGHGGGQALEGRQRRVRRRVGTARGAGAVGLGARPSPVGGLERGLFGLADGALATALDLAGEAAALGVGEVLEDDLEGVVEHVLDAAGAAAAQALGGRRGARRGARVDEGLDASARRAPAEEAAEGAPRLGRQGAVAPLGEDAELLEGAGEGAEVAAAGALAEGGAEHGLRAGARGAAGGLGAESPGPETPGPKPPESGQGAAESGQGGETGPGPARARPTQPSWGSR